MQILAHYVVLIERLIGRTARPLLLLWFGMAAMLAASPVQADSPGKHKLAPDLRQAFQKGPSAQRWMADIEGSRYVRVLIVSDSPDPEMTDLRAHVLAVGGSVYYRYLSVSALSALVPAQRLEELAQRPDVQSVSPNRAVRRTASALELATGAADIHRGSNGVPGLDGSGVGIAVLDSGIAWNHEAFQAADGRTSRVARAVDLTQLPDVSGRRWLRGVDLTAGRGRSRWAAFEQMIAADRSDRADQFGHGSHVAGIAAGRSTEQTLETTGMAPGAKLFDVKVLDGAGAGELADVLAGIDWVIYHAREYGIRVLNVSLAADSSESYLTDPLCRAVRSAVATGITVVVAAGNFGKDADGVEVYGGISAPGNDPSVITVGSAHTHDTAARSDDSVNFFSSRGPTRGGSTDSSGARQPDNLLKPDLVAPGNRIVSVLGSDRQGTVAGFSTLPRLYPEIAAPYGGTSQPPLAQLMQLSGTSMAANRASASTSSARPPISVWPAWLSAAGSGSASSMLKASACPFR